MTLKNAQREGHIFIKITTNKSIASISIYRYRYTHTQAVYIYSQIPGKLSQIYWLLHVITRCIPKIEQKHPYSFWMNSILCISKFLCFQTFVCKGFAVKCFPVEASRPWE